MPYCPNCHYEYEDWATTCSDCGAVLAAGAPPAPPAPAPAHDPAELRDWVILTNVPNVMMGNLLKDQLEQDGIPVLMKRAHATDVAEWSHNDFAWQDLYVPRSFVAQARELLASPPSRPQHSNWLGDEDDEWEADELDDADEEDPAGEDLPGAPPAAVPAGWYLIDSARPLPAGDDGAATLPGRRPVALPGLSRYQRGLTLRKDHRQPPPGESRVLPFRPPGAGDQRDDDRGYDGYADHSNSPSAWTHSRIYRILIGLLLLAWTLPFLLQMLQYFRDALARFFP